VVKVSIIVPVYKAEKCISKCVESLIFQSLKDIEIILVDDGSPDNSGIICDEYAKKDGRLRVIHKENGGVSSARNRGIEEATGEYILFVDSDDWVEPDYAEALYNTKQRYPNYEVLCGFRTVSDYEGTFVSENRFSKNEEDIVSFKRYMELMGAVLVQSPWNKLYRAAVIKNDNLRFDESLSLGEDVLFNLSYYDCCKSDNVFVLNVPLYNYIKTGGESLDNKYYPNLIILDEMIYTKLKEFISHHGADKKQLEIFDNSRFYRYIKALSNTYMEGNPASPKEKRKTNNEILRSAEFKKSLNEVTAYIHPIHKIAYKSGSWTLVSLAYKITSLKNKIIKR